MSEIKVTVLCTVYNHEPYLRKTLDGFVNQKTDFPFEVIVHDDASTDKSADIIKEYEKKYPDIIKPIYQKENQHSKHNPIYIMYMYPQVKGKYFAVCEGDDYWTDMNKLQMQYDALEAHPECSFSTHIVRSITESGEPLNVSFPAVTSFDEGVIKSEELTRIIFSKEFYPFQTSSYFFRSDLLVFLENSGKNFISSCPALDYGWILSSLVSGDCYYFPAEMSAYRRNSISSWSNRQKSKEVHSKYIEKISKSLEVYNLLTNQKYEKIIRDTIHKNEFTLMEYKEKYVNRKNPDYAECFNSLSDRQKFFLCVCRCFPPFSKVYEKMQEKRRQDILSA